MFIGLQCVGNKFLYAHSVFVTVFHLLSCPSSYLSIQCTNMREFSKDIFVPMFGFKSVHHMILEGSPHFRVSDINIPVVAMNAADDPFCPESSMYFNQVV